MQKLYLIAQTSYSSATLINTNSLSLITSNVSSSPTIDVQKKLDAISSSISNINISLLSLSKNVPAPLPYSTILKTNIQTSAPSTPSQISSINSNNSPLTNTSIPSIVIEHIPYKYRNFGFIKSLLFCLKLDYSTISHISFHSHYCNMILSSPCIRDYLLSSKLNGSTFK